MSGTWPATVPNTFSPGVGALADYEVCTTELAGPQPHDDVRPVAAELWCCRVPFVVTNVVFTRVFCPPIDVDIDVTDPSETCFTSNGQPICFTVRRTSPDCFDVPRDPARCV